MWYSLFEIPFVLQTASDIFNSTDKIHAGSKPSTAVLVDNLCNVHICKKHVMQFHSLVFKTWAHHAGNEKCFSRNVLVFTCTCYSKFRKTFCLAVVQVRSSNWGVGRNAKRCEVNFRARCTGRHWSSERLWHTTHKFVVGYDLTGGMVITQNKTSKSIVSSFYWPKNKNRTTWHILPPKTGPLMIIIRMSDLSSWVAFLGKLRAGESSRSCLIVLLHPVWRTEWRARSAWDPPSLLATYTQKAYLRGSTKCTNGVHHSQTVAFSWRTGFQQTQKFVKVKGDKLQVCNKFVSQMSTVLCGDCLSRRIGARSAVFPASRRSGPRPGSSSRRCAPSRRTEIMLPDFGFRPVHKGFESETWKFFVAVPQFSRKAG